MSPYGRAAGTGETHRACAEQHIKEAATSPFIEVKACAANGTSECGEGITNEPHIEGPVPEWDWERYVDEQIALLPPEATKGAGCVSRIFEAEKYADAICLDVDMKGANIARLQELTSQFNEQQRRLSESPAPPRPTCNTIERFPISQLEGCTQFLATTAKAASDLSSKHLDASSPRWTLPGSVSGAGTSCAGSKRIYSPIVPCRMPHLAQAEQDTDCTGLEETLSPVLSVPCSPDDGETLGPETFGTVEVLTQQDPPTQATTPWRSQAHPSSPCASSPDGCPRAAAAAGDETWKSPVLCAQRSSSASSGGTYDHGSGPALHAGGGDSTLEVRGGRTSLQECGDGTRQPRGVRDSLGASRDEAACRSMLDLRESEAVRGLVSRRHEHPPAQGSSAPMDGDSTALDDGAECGGSQATALADEQGCCEVIPESDEEEPTPANKNASPQPVGSRGAGAVSTGSGAHRVGSVAAESPGEPVEEGGEAVTLAVGVGGAGRGRRRSRRLYAIQPDILSLGSDSEPSQEAVPSPPRLPARSWLAARDTLQAPRGAGDAGTSGAGGVSAAQEEALDTAYRARYPVPGGRRRSAAGREASADMKQWSQQRDSFLRFAASTRKLAPRPTPSAAAAALRSWVLFRKAPNQAI